MNADDHLLAAAYSLDAVEADQAQAYEAHLAVCADCRQEVAEFSATASLLAQSVPVAVPGDLFARVMTQVRETPQLPPVVPTAARAAERPTPPPADLADGAPVDGGDATDDHHTGATVLAFRRRPARLLMSVAAALVFVLVGAAVISRLNGPSKLSSELAAVVDTPGRKTFTMEGGGGVARIHLAPDASKAAVDATGLPAVDEGKAYELWFIDGAGPHRAAVFRPDADGKAQAVFTPPVRSMDAMGVTVESAEGSDAPTTPIVMQVGA